MGWCQAFSSEGLGVQSMLGVISLLFQSVLYSQCRKFILVCNQPATQGQLSLPPSGVRKWVPASAGKAKAGMVHSISGWTWGVQVKLWDPLRTCAIPERLRGAFMIKCYTKSPFTVLHLTFGYKTWKPG